MQIFRKKVKQTGLGKETHFHGTCVRGKKNAAGAERGGPGLFRNAPLSSKRPWINQTVMHAVVLVSRYIFVLSSNT